MGGSWVDGRGADRRGLLREGERSWEGVKGLVCRRGVSLDAAATRALSGPGGMMRRA